MTRFSLALGVIFLWPALAQAAAPLGVACSVSPGGSSVVVHAFSTMPNAFQCTIWCKATVTGEAAFTPVTCSFRMSANMSDKIVCDQKAVAGTTFSGIATHQMTCVPR